MNKYTIIFKNRVIYDIIGDDMFTIANKLRVYRDGNVVGEFDKTCIAGYEIEDIEYETESDGDVRE